MNKLKSIYRAVDQKLTALMHTNIILPDFTLNYNASITVLAQNFLFKRQQRVSVSINNIFLLEQQSTLFSTSEC
jgi:hypothetical protein